MESTQEEILRLIDSAETQGWPHNQNACDTLTQIGQPAIPLLLQALARYADQHFTTWSNIIGVLGALHAVQAVPALITALAGENPHLRQAASKALGEIGDARQSIL